MKLIVVTQAPDLGKPSQTPWSQVFRERTLGFSV